MNKQNPNDASEIFSIISDTINGANFDDLCDAAHRIVHIEGYRKQSEVAREIFEEIEKEIVAALESNYRAMREHNLKRSPDADGLLLERIYGKIDALRGIEGFVEELEKKYTGGEDTNVPAKKDYYTPEEVRNMSHTEISNNLTVIRESMKRWREE